MKNFAAKDLIRWTKDGRRVHIFNPSSFTLSVFSLALIATGSTHLTWGPEIATTQLLPPHIYLLIFLVSLPGQYLFGVALMTLSAAGPAPVASLATNIVLAGDAAVPKDITDTAISFLAERILARMLPVRAIISPAMAVVSSSGRFRIRRHSTP